LLDVQAQRHAPALKVVVYDGVSRKMLHEEDSADDRKKRKKRKAFKKMTREERFRTSAVCGDCPPSLHTMARALSRRILHLCASCPF
jgi:hypothetical protein